ncbi:MAG TPA: folylpolyglutamate synthase/dihydrofolate synthase family protein [Bacteroidia bacterium]|nr:folylpolyglutamate synthase/dihydrofolate synthase family protein [Bacteroidia bacterium]
MNYSQTLKYLYERLPMFQRIGPAAYKADLDNTIAICGALHHPEKKFRSIHIAGTNGKGSTSHLLASILQEAGYKTGLYTSPHLKDFRERIRVNGEMIPKKFIVKFVDAHKKTFEKIEPSFFEWTVGLAFDFFARQKVDIAIIETGLGGRLDSTNVITPELSVITNISYDHMNLLGNTLKKIAGEKAGIIKKNIPVVIGETQPEVKNVFITKAKKENAPIIFADVAKKNISDRQIIKFNCPLKGNYQFRNIRTVLASVDLLRKNFPITEKQLHRGIKNVVKNTGLRGRWETISKKPLTICDTGHNEAGIREVVAQLNKMKFSELHFVLGVVNDKDPGKVLRLLPKKAQYYFCKAKLPRAMDADELRKRAGEFGLSGKNYSSVKNALKAARKNTGKNDLVFVGGSTFVVAEAI